MCSAVYRKHTKSRSCRASCKQSMRLHITFTKETRCGWHLEEDRASCNYSLFSILISSILFGRGYFTSYSKKFNLNVYSKHIFCFFLNFKSKKRDNIYYNVWSWRINIAVAVAIIVRSIEVCLWKFEKEIHEMHVNFNGGGKKNK